MAVTVMKINSEKQKPPLQYKNYKHFYEESSYFELNGKLLKTDINNAKLKRVEQTLFRSSW